MLCDGLGECRGKAVILKLWEETPSPLRRLCSGTSKRCNETVSAENLQGVISCAGRNCSCRARVLPTASGTDKKPRGSSHKGGRQPLCSLLLTYFHIKCYLSLWKMNGFGHQRTLEVMVFSDTPQCAKSQTTNKYYCFNTLRTCCMLMHLLSPSVFFIVPAHQVSAFLL